MSFSKLKSFVCQIQNDFSLSPSYKFYILRLVSIMSKFKAILNRVYNLISYFQSFIEVLLNQLTLYSIGEAIISEEVYEEFKIKIEEAKAFIKFYKDSISLGFCVKLYQCISVQEATNLLQEVGVDFSISEFICDYRKDIQLPIPEPVYTQEANIDLAN